MKRFVPILVLLALVLQAACRSKETRTEQQQSDAKTLRSPAESRRSNRAAVARFSEYVQSAADTIIAKSKDKKHHRLALRWKIDAIGSARRAITSREVFSNGLDLWILSVQYRIYFESGAGKDLFGVHQPIALEAARACERGSNERAKDTIKEGHFESARQKIAAFAEKHPIENYFVRQAFTADAVGQGGKSQGALAQMVGLPMDVLRTSFSPLEGVRSDVLRASMEISHAATNIGDIAEHLPEETRWQVELLTLDLEDYNAVVTGIESVDRVSRSAESLAKTAKELAAQTRTIPADIRREADGLITQIDAKQGNLQKTLEKADATAAQLDTTIKTAEGFTRSLNVTLTAVNETAVKWKDTIEVFYKLMDSLGAFPTEEDPTAAAVKPVKPAKPSGEAEEEDDGPPPFDINDFGAAARDLTVTAGQLKELVDHAEKLVTNPVLTQRLDEVDQTARATVDHVTWRAILVLAAAAAIALAYRFVRVKFLAG